MLNARCNGRTFFAAAFRAVEDFLDQSPGVPVAVVFMTDGRDTSGKANELSEATDVFRATLGSRLAPVVVHTLGFGSGRTSTRRRCITSPLRKPHPLRHQNIPQITTKRLSKRSEPQALKREPSDLQAKRLGLRVHWHR